MTTMYRTSTGSNCSRAEVLNRNLVDIENRVPITYTVLPVGTYQGCGSGSGLDPYSIGSVDPDSESGSGSRRAKMTHKTKVGKSHVLKCWMASFES